MRPRRQPTHQYLRRLNKYREFPAEHCSWIRRYRESDLWLWTEVGAVVLSLAFIIPTAIALWIDLEDRKTQRISQAWEIVTQVASGNSGKGPAMEYIHSQGISLTGIDLSIEGGGPGSFLKQVNLPGVNLEMANLKGANLTDANLEQAYLPEANLTNAILIRANLQGADVVSTNFQNADLATANLEGALLAFADLRRALLLGANLSGASLKGASLERANLSGANLVGAIMQSTNLKGAKLTNANLQEAYLENVILEDANLSGANLKGALKLDQKKIDQACGNDQTILPAEFTIKLCERK